MKFFTLAAPAALALIAGVAGAQTTTAVGNNDQGPAFGSQWSGTFGDRFFTDDAMTTLRPEADIRTGWDEMSETDRAMILADCEIVKANSDAAATATAETTDPGDDAAAEGTVVVTQDNMAKLCDVVSAD